MQRCNISIISDADTNNRLLQYYSVFISSNNVLISVLKNKQTIWLGSLKVYYVGKSRIFDF